MNTLPLTFDMAQQWPSSTIKLTAEQATALGIDIAADEIRGELKTFGPWQIPVSYKAICVSMKRGTIPGHYSESVTEKTVYGPRTLSQPKQDGYCLSGKVSINGKSYRAFTSSELFEVNGHLINVSVIHACIK
jgi:hypothetical protein